MNIIDVEVKGQITLFHCEDDKFVISHVLIYIQLLKFDHVHDCRGISKVCISTNFITLDNHDKENYVYLCVHLSDLYVDLCAETSG